MWIINKVLLLLLLLYCFIRFYYSTILHNECFFLLMGAISFLIEWKIVFFSMKTVENALKKVRFLQKITVRFVQNSQKLLVF